MNNLDDEDGYVDDLFENFEEIVMRRKGKEQQTTTDTPELVNKHLGFGRNARRSSPHPLGRSHESQGPSQSLRSHVENAKGFEHFVWHILPNIKLDYDDDIEEVEKRIFGERNLKLKDKTVSDDSKPSTSFDSKSVQENRSSTVLEPSTSAPKYDQDLDSRHRKITCVQKQNPTKKYNKNNKIVTYGKKQAAAKSPASSSNAPMKLHEETPRRPRISKCSALGTKKMSTKLGVKCRSIHASSVPSKNLKIIGGKGLQLNKIKNPVRNDKILITPLNEKTSKQITKLNKVVRRNPRMSKSSDFISNQLTKLVEKPRFTRASAVPEKKLKVIKERSLKLHKRKDSIKKDNIYTKLPEKETVNETKQLYKVVPKKLKSSKFPKSTIQQKRTKLQENPKSKQALYQPSLEDQEKIKNSKYYTKLEEKPRPMQPSPHQSSVKDKKEKPRFTRASAVPEKRLRVIKESSLTLHKGKDSIKKDNIRTMLPVKETVNETKNLYKVVPKKLKSSKFPKSTIQQKRAKLPENPKSKQALYQPSLEDQEKINKMEKPKQALYQPSLEDQEKIKNLKCYRKYSIESLNEINKLTSKKPKIAKFTESISQQNHTKLEEKPMSTQPSPHQSSVKDKNKSLKLDKRKSSANKDNSLTKPPEKETLNETKKLDKVTLKKGRLSKFTKSITQQKHTRLEEKPISTQTSPHQSSVGTKNASLKRQVYKDKNESLKLNKRKYSVETLDEMNKMTPKKPRVTKFTNSITQQNHTKLVEKPRSMQPSPHQSPVEDKNKSLKLDKRKGSVNKNNSFSKPPEKETLNEAKRLYRVTLKFETFNEMNKMASEKPGMAKFANSITQRNHTKLEEKPRSMQPSPHQSPVKDKNECLKLDKRKKSVNADNSLTKPPEKETPNETKKLDKVTLEKTRFSKFTKLISQQKHTRLEEKHRSARTSPHQSSVGNKNASLKRQVDKDKKESLKLNKRKYSVETLDEMNKLTPKKPRVAKFTNSITQRNHTNLVKKPRSIQPSPRQSSVKDKNESLKMDKRKKSVNKDNSLTKSPGKETPNETEKLGKVTLKNTRLSKFNKSITQQKCTRLEEKPRSARTSPHQSSVHDKNASLKRQSSVKGGSLKLSKRKDSVNKDNSLTKIFEIESVTKTKKLDKITLKKPRMPKFTKSIVQQKHTKLEGNPRSTRKSLSQQIFVKPLDRSLKLGKRKNPVNKDNKILTKALVKKSPKQKRNC